MGGHNRTCPSLRWAEMHDEQIYARDTRDWRERREAKFEVPKPSNVEPRTVVRLARLFCWSLSCHAQAWRI